MRNDNVKENADTIKPVPVFFEELQNKGAQFFIDGEPVFWKKAVETAVREESAYMTDYVMEDGGRIGQVRLDKVTQ